MERIKEFQAELDRLPDDPQGRTCSSRIADREGARATSSTAELKAAADAVQGPAAAKPTMDQPHAGPPPAHQVDQRAPRRSPRRCRWSRRRRCARRSRPRSTRGRSRGCSIASSAARRACAELHAPAARGARGADARRDPGRRGQGPVRRAQHQRVPRRGAVRSRSRPCSSPPGARRRSSSRARGRQLVAEFAYGDTPTFAEARAIAAFARDLFLNGEVDEVQHRRDAVRQHADAGARVARISCRSARSREPEVPGMRRPTAQSPTTSETLFEPNAEARPRLPARHYLNIYRLLRAAERQGERAERAHGVDEERDRQRRRR